MANTIEENTFKILKALSSLERPQGRDTHVDGARLSELTALDPADVNDAVIILEQSGLVDWILYMGTAPYTFGQVAITARGRYELERSSQPSTSQAEMGIDSIHRPSPVGSPYGFVDEDWEFVTVERNRGEQLRVVLGHQFESDHYDTDELRDNIEATLQKAVDRYKVQESARTIELIFKPLVAGYGEHLFNEIARDIIAADIAVFETSDMNPNVMVELGVALTWGVRVLPIKKEGRPKPPSDISGQTWADYRDSAREFVDRGHDEKLYAVVQRALRKKPRA